MNASLPIEPTKQAKQSGRPQSTYPLKVLSDLLDRVLGILNDEKDKSEAIKIVQTAVALLNNQADSARAIRIGKPVRGGLASWQIARIDQHLFLSLEKPVHVVELANITRLSKGHFQRAFKQTFQVSPHRYIVIFRLKHAKKLMLETRLPLSEIARACGFSDQAQMSRLFSREVGLAPNVWRRAKLAELNDDPSIRSANAGREESAEIPATSYRLKAAAVTTN